MTRRCPGDCALIDLFMNDASLPKKDKLLRHLAACRRCTRRFNVLRQAKRDLEPQVEAFAGDFDAREGAALLQAAARRQLADLEPGPSRSSPSPSASTRGAFGPLLGLRPAFGFLAVLLVLVAGAYLLVSRLERRSALRGPAIKLTLLAPVGAISAPPRLLRWTAVRGAESYLVELVDGSLRRVHLFTPFVINEVVVPPEVQARLVKSETYVWTVKAYDGDGNFLTERSASFSLE